MVLGSVIMRQTITAGLIMAALALSATTADPGLNVELRAFLSKRNEVAAVSSQAGQT